MFLFKAVYSKKASSTAGTNGSIPVFEYILTFFQWLKKPMILLNSISDASSKNTCRTKNVRYRYRHRKAILLLSFVCVKHCSAYWLSVYKSLCLTPWFKYTLLKYNIPSNLSGALGFRTYFLMACMTSKGFYDAYFHHISSTQPSTGRWAACGTKPKPSCFYERCSNWCSLQLSEELFHQLIWGPVSKDGTLSCLHLSNTKY